MSEQFRRAWHEESQQMQAYLQECRKASEQRESASSEQRSEEAQRADWRNHEAPDWAVPLEEVQRLRQLHGVAEGATLLERCKSAAQAVAAERAAGRAVQNYAAVRQATGRGVSDWTPEELARWNAEAEERFHAAAPEALARMGLGARAIEQLADLQDWPAIAHVREWLGTKNSWALVLGGLPGTGKTQALAFGLQRLGQECVRTTAGHVEHQWRPRSAHYRLATEIVTGTAFGAEGDARVAQLIAVPVLAIDDLGTEPRNEVGLDLLYRVLDGRYRNKRRTLIATNMKGPELRARYAGRIMRRLLEDSMWRLCAAPEAK